MKKNYFLIVFFLFLQNLIQAQDGTLDNSFQSFNASNNGIVRSVALQSDGKYIVAGNFEQYNGVYRYLIARINSDGSIDYSFQPPLSTTYTTNSFNTIYKVKIQPDGKILFCSNLLNSNFNSLSSYIVRLNTDGTLDTSFNFYGNGAVNDFVINPDNSIVCVGNFTSINGTTRNKIVKINSSGVVDVSFTPGTAFQGNNNVPYTITRRANGKYFVGGQFVLYNNFSCENFIGIASNGAVDFTFSSPTFNGAVNNILELADGKFLIDGYFNLVNGTTKPYAVRLTANGAIDTSFNVNCNNAIIKTLPLSNGKMIIIGAFTSVDAVNRNYIARLNNDGTLDATFQVGTGINLINGTSESGPFDLLKQPDDKIIISGYFLGYNDISRKSIFRLNNSVLSNSELQFSDKSIVLYPNPSNGIFNIQTTENINKIAVYNTLGQKVLEGNTLTIDLTNQPTGIYFTELVSSQGKSIQKIIKQ